MKDIRYIIAGLFLTCGIFSLEYDVIEGIYLALGYLILNSILVIFACSALLNLDVLKITPDAYTDERYRNPLMQWIIHIIHGIFLYHLIQNGFLFISGFFTFIWIMGLTASMMIFVSRYKK